MTCGVKHVMFWTLAGGQLVGKRGVLTQPEGEDSETTLKMQTMLSVAFGAVGVTSRALCYIFTTNLLCWEVVKMLGYTTGWFKAYHAHAKFPCLVLCDDTQFKSTSISNFVHIVLG